MKSSFSINRGYRIPVSSVKDVNSTIKRLRSLISYSFKKSYANFVLDIYAVSLSHLLVNKDCDSIDSASNYALDNELLSFTGSRDIQDLFSTSIFDVYNEDSTDESINRELLKAIMYKTSKLLYYLNTDEFSYKKSELIPEIFLWVFDDYVYIICGKNTVLCEEINSWSSVEAYNFSNFGQPPEGIELSDWYSRKETWACITSAELVDLSTDNMLSLTVPSGMDKKLGISDYEVDSIARYLSHNKDMITSIVIDVFMYDVKYKNTTSVIFVLTKSMKMDLQHQYRRRIEKLKEAVDQSIVFDLGIHQCPSSI